MTKCSPLLCRVTLVILSAVAIWITIHAIVQMIAINQVDPTRRPPTLSTSYTMAWIQLIVGVLSIIYVLYCILAPKGTFREYIVPTVYEREEVVSRPPPLRRRTPAAVSEDNE